MSAMSKQTATARYYTSMVHKVQLANDTTNKQRTYPPNEVDGIFLLLCLSLSRPKMSVTMTTDSVTSSLIVVGEAVVILLKRKGKM